MLGDQLFVVAQLLCRAAEHAAAGVEDHHIVGNIERQIVAVSPNMSMTDGNLEFEFFDGKRYNEALGGRTP